MAEYQSKHTGAQIDAGIDRANAALPLSGGTMTGALILSGDPAAELGAATKGYVDGALAKLALIPGKDGATFTPSISSEGILTWTNDAGLANPPQANIRGADGFSPVVSVEETESGHRITITDAKGAQSFDVSGGSGNTGGVSSWKELTDKPFGEESLIPVIPETTTAISDETGVYDTALLKTPSVGSVYSVLWNGTQYRVSGLAPTIMGAAPGDACVVLGNAGAISGGTDTGEPFIIVLSPDRSLEVYAAIMPLDGSAEVTWSVTEVSFSRIPQTCLPEDYPLMWVNVTGDNPSDWTGDRSFAEISAAISGGSMVFLKIKGTDFIRVATLLGLGASQILFTHAASASANIVYSLDQNGAYSVSIE